MAHGNSYDKESVQAPGSKWGGLSIGLLVVGIAVMAGGYFMGGKDHSNHSYLTSFMFYLSIALGGLFFVLLQHLTRAGWSVVVRRLAEGFMKNLLWMLILVIPILLNAKTIFAWADTRTAAEMTAIHGGHGHGHEADAHGAADAHGEKGEKKADADVKHFGGAPVASDGKPTGRIDYAHAEHRHHLSKVLGKKKGYLNLDFFYVRVGIYFLIWIVMALFMWKNSVAQDDNKDPKLTIKMGKVSAGTMFFFAMSLTFAVFDMIMSLDYAWFSTIFGVIYFSGGVVGIMAALIIASFVLQKKGYLKGAVTTEHYHDMGKLMFAFVIFWAYVSFSQFMLIRYPDIPEETGWFLIRWTQSATDAGWRNWSIWIPMIHFVIPFALLMSRHVKRNHVTVTLMAVWMLVASYLHIYWEVMPTLNYPLYTPPHFGLNDVLIALGMGLFFIGGFLFNIKSVKLIPVGDPRLQESLDFQNY